METLTPFEIDLSEYAVRRLQPEDAEALQRLFERCADFNWLVEGEPVSSTAGQDAFQDVPPGRPLSDLWLFGLIDQRQAMAGLLEGIRHYPDESTWWIGLLVLAPEVRGRGVGPKLLTGFCDYVGARGGQALMLGVVEENVAALRFWQRMGFEVQRQTAPRQFGKKWQTVYVMRREIAPLS